MICAACQEPWPAVLLDASGQCPDCINPQTTQEVDPMTDTPTNPTVSDLLPPRVRNWVYALSLVAQFVLVSIAAMTEQYAVVGIIQGAIAAAGFGVATLHPAKAES